MLKLLSLVAETRRHIMHQKRTQRAQHSFDQGGCLKFEWASKSDYRHALLSEPIQPGRSTGSPVTVELTLLLNSREDKLGLSG